MNRRKFLKTAVAVMATAFVGTGCTPKPQLPPPQPRTCRGLGQAQRDIIELMNERYIQAIIQQEDKKFLLALRAAA